MKAAKEYSALLSDRRPRVIRNQDDYASAMREVRELAMRSEQRTEAENEYYSLLSTLVEAYERSLGVPDGSELSPLDFLREAMDQQEITQAQVAKALGDRAAASSILSGRRQISKAQAKKLAVLFHVDAGAFI